VTLERAMRDSAAFPFLRAPLSAGSRDRPRVINANNVLKSQRGESWLQLVGRSKRRQIVSVNIGYPLIQIGR